jgi:hypothetical protein
MTFVCRAQSVARAKAHETGPPEQATPRRLDRIRITSIGWITLIVQIDWTDI